jgi:hypothetical protein
VRGKTLEGMNPRRATRSRRCKQPKGCGGLSRGVKPWRRGGLNKAAGRELAFGAALRQRDGDQLLESGWTQVFQRQEGNGTGDGVRLRGRSKALKGEPHERIRHEIRPAGSGRTEASRGCENLEAQAGRAWEARSSCAAAPSGETLKGTELQGRMLC